MHLTWIDHSPRRVFLGLAVGCLILLGFGLYLQHVVGLNPCPMCIVQRYAMLAIVFVAGLTALSARHRVHVAGSVLLFLNAGLGAFVAARQSWLQWYPPEVVSCGRDFYGMIENFPIGRVVPMIFRGSGDCSKIDWVFLGGSLANWSFVCFLLIAGLAVRLAMRPAQTP
jgi:disulfide bond formation protein DsbB